MRAAGTEGGFTYGEFKGFYQFSGALIPIAAQALHLQFFENSIDEAINYLGHQFTLGRDMARKPAEDILAVPQEIFDYTVRLFYDKHLFTGRHELPG